MQVSVPSWSICSFAVLEECISLAKLTTLCDVFGARPTVTAAFPLVAVVLLLPRRLCLDRYSHSGQFRPRGSSDHRPRILLHTVVRITLSE